MAFTHAYDAYGRRVRIPAHWLAHPVLSRGFTAAPVAPAGPEPAPEPEAPARKPRARKPRPVPVDPALETPVTEPVTGDPIEPPATGDTEEGE